VLIPIALYLAMTLVVPLLNGSPVDAEHAVVVVAVAALVGLVFHKATRRLNPGSHMRSSNGLACGSAWRPWRR